MFQRLLMALVLAAASIALCQPVPLCETPKIANNDWNQNACLDHVVVNGGNWCNWFNHDCLRSRHVYVDWYANGAVYQCTAWDDTGCCGSGVVQSYPPCPTSTCDDPAGGS